MKSNSKNALVILIFAATLWGSLALASLSIRDFRGEWDHAVCGVWGCSPPVAAVISMHLMWLLFLLPLAAWVFKTYPTRIARITANTVLVIVCVAVLIIIGYEYQRWYLFVAESSRQYFLRRIGLVLATAVDFPVLPLIITAMLLRCGVAFRRVDQRTTEDSSLSLPGGEPESDHLQAAPQSADMHE